MENNRIFGFLWRANAVFLFIAGIGLIALLIMFAALLIAESRSWDKSPPAVSTTQSGSKVEEVFEVRHPSNYSETLDADFTYFELRSGKDSYGSLGKGSSSQLRNIGVYNLNTDETRWVFPDQQQDIESFQSVGKITLDENHDKQDIRTGFLLTVAKTLPDRSIARDLWAMSPDGKTLTKILSDIPRSPSIRTYGKSQKKLIIDSETHIDVYPFDVDMLTVGKATRVTIP